MPHVTNISNKSSYVLENTTASGFHYSVGEVKPTVSTHINTERFPLCYLKIKFNKHISIPAYPLSKAWHGCYLMTFFSWDLLKEVKSQFTD